ncbi:MAG: hypothetical protein O2971_06630 [Proteobacteria bacterium]|nr:hypothetical protein [Pseudomonadota bacterium]
MLAKKISCSNEIANSAEKPGADEVHVQRENGRTEAHRTSMGLNPS